MQLKLTMRNDVYLDRILVSTAKVYNDPRRRASILSPYNHTRIISDGPVKDSKSYFQSYFVRTSEVSCRYKFFQDLLEALALESFRAEYEDDDY